MAGQAVAMPRSRHGESLKTPGLPDGIASFFPVHSEQSTLTQGTVVDRGIHSCGSRRVCPAPDQHGWRQLSNHLSEWPLIERAKQGIAPLEESGVKEGAEGDEDESGDEGED